MSKKSPQLRFEGFTDDWEERKLGEVVKRVTRKNKELESTLPLTISAQEGLIDQNEFFNKTVASRDVSGYYLVKNGEFAYNKSYSNGYPWGAVKRLNRYDMGVLSTLYIVFKPIKINSDFLEKYYDTTYWYKEVSKHAAEGARNHGLLNIAAYDFFETKIVIPSKIEEQQKIGALFKQLDKTIALHQRKLDLLKEQKKGYLQKMFPKNGAKVPELRFAWFADDWEERKLSSMTNYKNGKSHEDKQSTSGKLELINLNSISISGGLKHSGKFIDEADDTLQKDDLVMILSDVGHGDLLGRVALIPEDDRFVLNQRVALLRPNTTADPQFLFSYINAHQYYFKAQGAGMSQLNISKGSVENFISFVPIIEEQKKIGAFYKRLDDTIALHQRKLDLLKEQKKGFLQKMFV